MKSEGSGGGEKTVRPNLVLGRGDHVQRSDFSVEKEQGQTQTYIRSTGIPKWENRGWVMLTRSRWGVEKSEKDRERAGLIDWGATVKKTTGWATKVRLGE